MALPLTFFILLLMVTLVSGSSFLDGKTTRRPRKGSPMEGRRDGPREGRMAMNRNRDRHQRSYGSKENLECQDGDSWGVNYSGNMNHTTSGRACQAWSAQEPHEHEYTEIGEHNHCRNSFLDAEGVWCFTTDPDMLWDYCPVPICAPMLKVLDFSADNDHEPDSNGEYTALCAFCKVR